MITEAEIRRIVDEHSGLRAEVRRVLKEWVQQFDLYSNGLSLDGFDIDGENLYVSYSTQCKGEYDTDYVTFPVRLQTV